MMATSPSQLILLGTANSDGTFTGVTSGTSVPINCAGYDELCFTFESLDTTSGGTILIEEASRPNYSGTWSTVATVAPSTFSGGAQMAYHISPTAYAFVRVRISSAVTGGGSVVVFLNKQGA